VGLIGSDLGPSLSPLLHEREADHLGLDYTYERIDIGVLGIAPERVGELVRAARVLGYRGLNITHPCKRLVLAHLDDISRDAARLGAVNVVTFERGAAIGHNTDWQGFQQSFARGLPDVPLNRVVLLGAGGAGAAVAHAAMSLGVQRLLVLDPERYRADALARTLCLRHGAHRAAVCERLDADLARADGLINASPVGMACRPGMPLAPDLLHKGMWVADVVYTPLETELLRHARAIGCRTLDGGGMAVIQAALSLELFTGLQADLGRMLRHFEALGDRKRGRWWTPEMV
jgi:shikimate dehydrogenase